MDSNLLARIANPQGADPTAYVRGAQAGNALAGYDAARQGGNLLAQGDLQGANALALRYGQPDLATKFSTASGDQSKAILMQGIAEMTQAAQSPQTWEAFRQRGIAAGHDLGDFTQAQKAIAAAQASYAGVVDPSAAAGRAQQASQFVRSQAQNQSQFNQTIDKPVPVYDGQTFQRPSEAVKVGSGPVTAVDPATITKNYNLVLDPDQAARFALLPDKRRSDAAGLLTGSQVINDLPNGMRNPRRLQAIQDARMVDPTYDEVSSKAGNTFEQSKTTQQFIANANTASSTVDRLVELSNEIDRSNLTLLNNGTLAVKSATSDPTTKQYLTEYNILADELGKILGSGQGSDFAIKLGQSLIDPNASQAAVAAQGQEVKGRIVNKLGEYKRQFRQGSIQPPDTAQPQGQDRFASYFSGNDTGAAPGASSGPLKAGKYTWTPQGLVPQ